MKYDLETIVYKNGNIEQTLFSTFNGIKNEIYKQIIKTEEEEVRKALIKLGWIPPEGKTKGDKK